jgi:histidine ammonia-lyase
MRTSRLTMTPPSVADDSMQELLQDTLCCYCYVSVHGGLANAYRLLEQELFFTFILS